LKHRAALRASRSRKNKTAIPLNKNYRIYATDSHNWSLQKCSSTTEEGEVIWLSQIFYHDLRDLLRATAKRMINNELKLQGEASDLRDLAAKIEKAEAKVLARLQNIVDESSEEEEDEDEDEEDEELEATG
jgi:hypothetical protein